MTLQPFVSLTALAAPFPEGQIDTDVIFPARFLLLMEKRGLGGTSSKNAAPRVASCWTRRPGTRRRSW